MLASKASLNQTAAKESRLKVWTLRTELSGFLCLARMVTAIIGGFLYPILNIFLATDSECMISTIKTKDQVLQVRLGNCVAEIAVHMKSLDKTGVLVENIHHLPSHLNVAD